jgi:hypothetical protein
MYKKRLLFLILVFLFFTGCTKITDNLDEIVNDIMSEDSTILNTVSTGYELYVPAGVKQEVDSEYNQKFRIKNRYVYLYVDTISYFYKNTLNYKKVDSYSYYYKEISLNNKTGYVGINKVSDDLYFCEIVYNYSKTEFYSDLDDLGVLVSNALIMQKSIKYNDSLITTALSGETETGRDIKYELDKPKDAESTFDAYLKEVEDEEEEETELPNDNQ